MMKRQTSLPFGRPAPGIRTDDALRGVGRISRAEAKATFQQGAGTRRLGCDGLPILTLQTGVACSDVGIPVNVLRSGGESIELPGPMGIGGVGGSNSVMAMIGGPVIVNPCDPTKRRFIDMWNNAWDATGQWLGAATGGGVTPVKVGNEYFVDYYGGAYPNAQPSYICASGASDIVIGDGMGAAGSPGSGAIQIGVFDPNPAMAAGYLGHHTYDNLDSYPTLPSTGGRKLHHDGYCVGRGPLAGYTFGMERKIFPNPSYPSPSEFAWVGAYAMTARSGDAVVTRDTRFVNTGNGAVGDSAGAVDDWNGAGAPWDVWCDDCGTLWVARIRGGFIFPKVIWQGTWSRDGGFVWDADVILGNEDPDGNILSPSPSENLVRTIYLP